MNWFTYLANFTLVIGIIGISLALGIDPVTSVVFYTAIEIGTIKGQLYSR